MGCNCGASHRGASRFDAFGAAPALKQRSDSVVQMIGDIQASSKRVYTGAIRTVKSLSCNNKTRLVKFPNGWPKQRIEVGETINFCGELPADVVVEELL